MDIRKRLEFLGTASADQIARSLKNMGIKGKMCHHLSCPLTIWIKSAPDFKEGVTISIGGTSVLMLRANSESEFIYLTDEQIKFINRFDRGLYPELISLPVLQLDC